MVAEEPYQGEGAWGNRVVAYPGEACLQGEGEDRRVVLMVADQKVGAYQVGDSSCLPGREAVPYQEEP